MLYIFFFLLFGHALGDFYFISDKQFNQKKKNFSSLVLHIILYSAAVSSILFATLEFSTSLLILLVGVLVSHIIVELCTYFLNHIRAVKGFGYFFKKYCFYVEQIIHILTITGLSLFFNENTIIREFFKTETVSTILTISLAILYLLNPVSIFITEFFLASGLRRPYESDSTRSTQLIRAGKIIGMLERILVFILIYYSQYAAIGFLLTAKTVTRFKDLENRDIAEYYLIGTLLSIVIAFIVSILARAFILAGAIQ